MATVTSSRLDQITPTIREETPTKDTPFEATVSKVADVAVTSAPLGTKSPGEDSMASYYVGYSSTLADAYPSPKNS